MPLTKSKSKKAFKHNLEAELDAGKPKDQALAIAYDVQRRSKPHRKMANGGMVEDLKEGHPETLADAIRAKHKAKMEPSDKEIVDSIEEMPEEHHDETHNIAHEEEPLPFPTSRAEAIRRKVKALRGE